MMAGTRRSAGSHPLLRSYWVFYLAVFAAGCGPFTFPVTFSPTAPIEPPTTGRAVWVTVTDERMGDSSTWLGVVRAGDIVGDYVLTQESVALRVTHDVVAALRAKGYRAEPSDGPTRSPEDTLLHIRIIRLATFAFAGAFKTPKWQGSSAFICRSEIGTSPDPLWLDFVYVFEIRLMSTFSRKKEQEAVEAFYRAGIDEVVRKFVAAVPP